MKTHQDQIWISADKEKHIVSLLNQHILSQGFVAENYDIKQTLGYTYMYSRGDTIVHCRVVDSVFLLDSDAFTRPYPNTIITDNIPLVPISGRFINLLPEFWAMWHFEPVYQDRPATIGFNCFMNRVRGDRSLVFYELIRRQLLDRGLVSYNCNKSELMNQFEQAELYNYWQEHDVGLSCIPYNTVEAHGGLEQCIIDSNISLILETYISDSHIVFSEKIFRALQLPRPWLLYCSPGSIAWLKHYGFDVLEDYVDIFYDQLTDHHTRLKVILDQLEIFINHSYTQHDYDRFNQAANHNQTRLKQLEQEWPEKFNRILKEIKQL